MVSAHMYHICYTNDSQIWNCDHYPLMREMRNELGRHSQELIRGRSHKFLVEAGAQMELRGSRAKEAQDGHFCRFPALSLSSHLP